MYFYTIFKKSIHLLNLKLDFFFHCKMYNYLINEKVQHFRNILNFIFQILGLWQFSLTMFSSQVFNYFFFFKFPGEYIFIQKN